LGRVEKVSQPSEVGQSHLHAKRNSAFRGGFRLQKNILGGPKDGKLKSSKARKGQSLVWGEARSDLF